MSVEKEQLRDRIIEALKEIYDPEIPVNLYDMGMIYEIEITDGMEAHVKMTLTSPTCPVAETLPGEVEVAVAGVEGVSRAVVKLVWVPTWHQGMLSEAAKLQLGLM